MIYKFSVIYLFTIILYQLTYSPKPLKVFRSFFKNVSVLCNNVRSSTLPDISFIYLAILSKRTHKLQQLHLQHYQNN